MINKPRTGDHLQLRGTEIVAEVTSVSGSWLTLDVSNDDFSMHWRERFSQDFERRWMKGPAAIIADGHKAFEAGGEAWAEWNAKALDFGD